MRHRRPKPGPPGLPPGTAGKLREALREDRWTHDATTRALFPGRLDVRAQVIAQAPGVLSGVQAAEMIARIGGLRATARLVDGARVHRGSVVLELRGDLRRILSVERTLLNFLMHLSGVATATERAVRAARMVRPGFRVRATRKTLPGLRDLEKAAVVHGGGEPHRRDLSDAVLIKGNHLAVVPVAEAVRRGRRRVDGRPLQVEVHSLAQARAALGAGARSLLIDNLSPRAAHRLIRSIRRFPAGATADLEVSGGIDGTNVAAYARSGADAASLGSLTHSAPALPFHLVVVPPRGSR